MPLSRLGGPRLFRRGLSIRSCVRRMARAASLKQSRPQVQELGPPVPPARIGRLLAHRTLDARSPARRRVPATWPNRCRMISMAGPWLTEPSDTRLPAIRPAHIAVPCIRPCFLLSFLVYWFFACLQSFPRLVARDGCGKGVPHSEHKFDTFPVRSYPQAKYSPRLRRSRRTSTALLITKIGYADTTAQANQRGMKHQ